MHSVYIYIRKIRRGILGIYKYCDKYRNVRNYFIGSYRVPVLSLSSRLNES